MWGISAHLSALVGCQDPVQLLSRHVEAVLVKGGTGPWTRRVVLIFAARTNTLVPRRAFQILAANHIAPVNQGAAAQLTLIMARCHPLLLRVLVHSLTTTGCTATIQQVALPLATTLKQGSEACSCRAISSSRKEDGADLSTTSSHSFAALEELTSCRETRAGLANGEPHRICNSGFQPPTH